MILRTVGQVRQVFLIMLDLAGLTLMLAG